tara:strand:- start:889 stop:1278 length:390 start_codon:yes stop_codon:yes gene_type:complete
MAGVSASVHRTIVYLLIASIPVAAITYDIVKGSKRNHEDDTKITSQSRMFASYLTGTVWAAGTLLSVINGQGFTKKAAAVMLFCLVMLLFVSVPVAEDSHVVFALQRDAALVSFGVFMLSCCVAVMEKA